MIRHLILFCAALFLFAPAGMAATTADAGAVVKALMDYCVAPVEGKTDPAAFATTKGLPEYAPDQAIQFSPEGGRVFEIPTLKNSAVLMTSKGYDAACNVAVRQISAMALWAKIDEQFTIKSKFKLMREKRNDDEQVTKREYDADLNGPVTLLVTVSDGPRPSGIQALITIARVKK